MVVEGVFHVQEWMSRHLILAGVAAVALAEVAGVEHIVQLLFQQLVILFLAGDVLFVVIPHILQMSAQTGVLDAVNTGIHSDIFLHFLTFLA